MGDEMIDTDTVFLFGAGAEQNPWNPVIKAISGCQIKGGLDPSKVTCPESATSFFATLVNYRRHAQLLDNGAVRTQLAKFHSALKADIASELNQAVDSGAIKLRPEFLRMAAEYGEKGPLAFLTTNWDPLMENELRRLNRKDRKLAYLHGKISEPDLMLLPGEIIAEPYRDTADRKRMETKLFPMWNIIEHTRRLVIYGHSISAVEAELRVMLCMGFSEAPGGEIVIVNLRKEAEAVRRRLLPLIPTGHLWKIESQPVDLKSRCGTPWMFRCFRTP